MTVIYHETLDSLNGLRTCLAAVLLAGDHRIGPVGTVMHAMRARLRLSILWHMWRASPSTAKNTRTYSQANTARPSRRNIQHNLKARFVPS